MFKSDNRIISYNYRRISNMDILTEIYGSLLLNRLIIVVTQKDRDCLSMWQNKYL